MLSGTVGKDWIGKVKQGFLSKGFVNRFWGWHQATQKACIKRYSANPVLSHKLNAFPLIRMRFLRGFSKPQMEVEGPDAQH